MSFDPCFWSRTGAVKKRSLFIPEKDSLSVSWLSIPAGGLFSRYCLLKQSMESALPFLNDGQTYEAIDFIYKIRDRMDSYADEDMTRSLLYKQHRDERGERVTVRFDWEKKKPSMPITKKRIRLFQFCRFLRSTLCFLFLFASCPQRSHGTPAHVMMERNASSQGKVIRETIQLEKSPMTPFWWSRFRTYRRSFREKQEWQALGMGYADEARIPVK